MHSLTNATVTVSILLTYQSRVITRDSYVNRIETVTYDFFNNFKSANYLLTSYYSSTQLNSIQ